MLPIILIGSVILAIAVGYAACGGLTGAPRVPWYYKARAPQSEDRQRAAAYRRYISGR